MWATQALDPFHDVPVRAVGLPDHDSTRTVTEIITKSFSLSAPGGSGNWDAVISFQPFDSIHVLSPGEMNYAIAKSYCSTTTVNDTSNTVTAFGGNIPASASTLNVGSLTCLSWSSAGSPRSFFPDGTTTWTPPTASTALSPLTASNALDIGTRYRVVAAGFEVINTTAELYKQGTTTVVRVPARWRQRIGFFTHNNSATVQLWSKTTASNVSGPIFPASQRICDSPPVTISDALVQGGVQWEAKDGAYVVCTFDPNQNPIRAVSGSHLAMATNYDDDDIADTGGVGTIAYNTMGEQTDAYVYTAGTSQSLTPSQHYFLHENAFDISACYLSGLSTQSTFPVVVKWTVEIAPRTSDHTYGVFAPIAGPSPDYDALALATYQEVARRMPPGVPQNENPLGEWFSTVCGLASQVLPIVAPFLSPVGAAAATVGGALAGRAAKAIEKKVEKKIEKKVLPAASAAAAKPQTLSKAKQVQSLKFKKIAKR